MTQEQQISLRRFLQEKFYQDTLKADSELEIKMLTKEYENNLEKIENGVNIFDNKGSKGSEGSDYECIGCGA
jgi:predicted ribosome quality control (RQC) complex YloA/Tae2 family protein